MLRARAAKGIEEEVQQGVRIPVGRGFAGRIAAERGPITIDDVDHADILNPILREKGIRSLLGVPLLVEGRVLGVLHVGTLTRAHVHRRGPRPAPARRRPRRAGDRARPAVRASARRAPPPRPRRGSSRPCSGSPTPRSPTCPRTSCSPSCWTASREILRTRHRRDPPARARPRRCCGRAPPRGSRRRSSRASRIPVGNGFAGRIAAERAGDHDRRRRPRRHPQPDPAREGHPLAARRPAARRGPRARRAARRHAHPARASPPRTPTCSSSPPTAPRSRSSTPSCTSSAGSPRRCSAGCSPQELPAHPGLELASALPPASGESLGGDWYDAFELGGGRIVLAVGDVVGHGLAAAAVMAQLRAALRAYAIEDHPPAGGRRAREHA